jgi:hypothetical protein
MEQLSEGSAQAVADPPAANRPAQDNRTPFGLIFYLVASLLSLFMLLAVIAPDKTPFVKDQVFPGLAQAERPLRELFSRGLIWAWVAVGLGVVLLSLIALAIVKATAKPQDAPTPGTAFSWRKIYSIRLRLTDFMVITWAVCGAQMVWFGLPLSINAGIGDSSRVSQQWLSLVIIVGWMVALDLMGAWRSLFYGEGTTEYGRVFMASFAWAGAVAIIATLVKLTMSRGYLLLAFPLGLLGLLASHKLWRIWLVVKRTRQTLYTQRAVVVAGSSQGAERVLAEFQRSPTAGYTALAVALPTGAEPSPALLQKGLKLVDAADAVSAMRSSMADSLVVADSALLGVGLVQRFGWSLDPKNDTWCWCRSY